jgi:uncharacterized repeat protein (TIGR02543 family)
MKKKVLSLLLAVVMLSGITPVSFAESGDDAVLRQTLFESVKEEEYPNGMIDFLTPRMETSEDVKTSEFAVIRRGNTDEAASVTFKAVDMTAKYGEDYKIKIKDGLFKKGLKENPDAKLMSEEMYDEDEVVGMVAAETNLLEDTEANQGENAETDLDAGVGTNLTEEPKMNPREASGTFDGAELSGEQEQIKTGGGDLRSARSAFTGEVSDDSTWEESDGQTTALLSSAYGEMYDELAGAEYTLKFEPGEYMKTLEFITIDDRISEDEEQVLFVLSGSENSSLSDNPTGFMNIKDNDELEEITCEFTAPSVTIAADEDTAILEIQRKTGVQRYGTVMVSTASGTAEADIDYTPFYNEVTFAPGQEYQKIEVPVRNHPLSEQSSFYVRLNDNEAEAEVVIAPINAPAEEITPPLETTEITAKNAEVALAASEGWEAGQPAPWSRWEDVASPSGWDGHAYLWFDDGPTSKSWDIWRDLRMKMTVDFTTQDVCSGWYVKTRNSGHWYRDTNPNSQTDRFAIGGSTRWETKEKHGRTSRSYTIPNNKRTSSQKLSWSVSGSGDAHKCELWVTDIRLYSTPVLIQLGAEDHDAYIQKKIYTSPTDTIDDGGPFKAGTLKFQGVDDGVTNKFYYEDDMVTFDPAWDSSLTDEEKEGLYLWGFKIQTKAGGMPDFYYVKGDSFKLSDLYLNQLKDSITGKTIGSQAQQSVSISGTTFPCYRIYPVYKQKTAYTLVQTSNNSTQLWIPFAPNTFQYDKVIKTGRLDTLRMNFVGNDGDVLYFMYYYYRNHNKASSTDPETERNLLYDETADTAHKRMPGAYEVGLLDLKYYNIWPNGAIPGKVDFKPRATENYLEPSTISNAISMTVNPAANNASDQSKGAVMYMPEKGNVQTAAFTGVDPKTKRLKGSEIQARRYNVGGMYQFVSAISDEDKYIDKDHKLAVMWTDMTGDLNRDGVLTKEESFALGESEKFINRGNFCGDTFTYVPQLSGNMQLYYQIVPKALNDTGHNNSVAGTVKLKTATVADHSKSKSKEIPLEGAHIIVNGLETSTDKNGRWKINSPEFDTNETYMVIVEYGGKNYTASAMVNKEFSDIIIDEYNTFDVTNFKASRVENKSQYENTKDWKATAIDECAVSNEDKRHLYTFAINELNRGTITVKDVEVNRYDASGALKDTYTAVYNKKTRLYEVKKPSLLGTDDYNYSINPATEKVGAGDYFTICIKDQNGVGYIEHKVGMAYKPRLSVLTVINSFESPFSGVIEYLNKMDTSLDLGFTQKLDDFVENKAEVTNTEDERTISFGWSKDFKKSYDGDKKKDDKAPDTPAEAIKESAKKLENVSAGDDKSEAEQKEDDKAKDEAKNTANQAVDKNGKDNKKNGKANADLKFQLSVGVSIVMGYDSGANKYYFKDLVVTGIIDGNAEASYKYTTPVGIAIMVKAELSGDITAMMVTEPFYKNPDKPNYLYMSEQDHSINLTKLGGSDVNRQLSIYGKLMLRPKVTLSAGVSFVKLASLTLSGSADFDMIFTTANAGMGNVTLSSELVLGLIGDKIKKKWLIAKKKYDMFNINGSSYASLMSDGDYRYDMITEDDVDEKLYLNNRSYGFGETNGISLADVSVDRYNEHVMETGAYPSAYPLIETISEGTAQDGSDTSMIMLFLDADETGTTLNYSICENNIWSQPQPIEADGADDDTPQIYDLGDRFLITWSSETAGIDETDFTARFNSRNIRAVFFDKTAKTFGDVMEVTRTTDSDTAADDSAAVADYTAPDGTRTLLMTYVKSLYEQVNDDELLVGDVLNPYSTIAYRFYDYDTNTWSEEYSESDRNALSLAMGDDAVAAYTENWYGQGFADLAKYVDVDDSSILIQEDDEELGTMAGKWSRQPESGEITIKRMSSDPQVAEHEMITCGKYAVSAYLVDLDKESSTIEDREIFLQLYDFAEKKFYPLIRLTNDAVNQQCITLSETPEGVMLYYVSDGDIVSLNITNMISRALYKTTAKDGTEVLIKSNCYTGYAEESIIALAEENHPFTEFVVNAAEDAVLLSWTQNSNGYKDGIDPTSDAATDPENYYKERQIYTMMETFDDFEEPYYDENGEIATYPDRDDDGNIIDYDLEPDVNGQLGVVKAGDPMIRNGQTTTWTKPVRITEEAGANFSDIDCVIAAPGLLRMVYLKGMSVVQDISGTNIPVEDTDNRSLIVSDFDFDYEMLDGVITNGDEVAAGQEGLYINVEVSNEAIWEMSDIKVKLYERTKDGEKKQVGEETIERLNGGMTTCVSIPWNVPESLDGVQLIAETEQDGFIFSTDSWEYGYDGQIVIDEISHEFIDRDTARLQITVSNNGSENAADEAVYVNVNGSETSSEPFTLIPGEQKVITMDMTVPSSEFTDTSNEEQISEKAALRIYTQYDIHDYGLTRSADKALVEQMNGAIIKNAETGESYTDKITAKTDDIVELSAISGNENELNMEITQYDTEAVTVVNHMISPQREGESEIRIDLYPDIDTYISTDDGYMKPTETYLSLPSSLVKSVNLTLSASENKTGSSGGGGGNSSYTVAFDTQGGGKIDSVRVNRSGVLSKPTDPTREGYTFDGWFTDKEGTKAYDFSTKVTENFTLYAKWREGSQQPSGWNNPFTDVKESDWFYDNVRYACENKLFSGVSDSLFAPNEPMTRAMLVTVLYRADGSPDMENEIWGDPFADVDPQSWYGKAVYWARKNGIVKGYSDKEFAPDKPLSREEFATVIKRYADFKGIGTNNTSDLTMFKDSGAISDWAVNSMKWSIGYGLIFGRENYMLDPLGKTTRAETAAMLQRFIENSK